MKNEEKTQENNKQTMLAVKGRLTLKNKPVDLEVGVDLLEYHRANAEALHRLSTEDENQPFATADARTTSARTTRTRTNTGGKPSATSFTQPLIERSQATVARGCWLSHSPDIRPAIRRKRSLSARS